MKTLVITVKLRLFYYIRVMRLNLAIVSVVMLNAVMPIVVAPFPSHSLKVTLKKFKMKNLTTGSHQFSSELGSLKSGK